MCWRRLKGWRRILSQGFDPAFAPGVLQSLGSLTLQHGPHALTQCWLIVGWLARRLAGHEHVHFGELGGADARKALLLVGVMTVHSMAEGAGVGVAFGGGDELGLVTTIAIAIHNIPEGVAISLVLVPQGVGVLRAAGWSVFSSLPQPVVAVPAFLFVAYSGYYTDVRVVEALGFEARPPHPQGYEMGPDDLSLLEAVRRRGKLYREC